MSRPLGKVQHGVLRSLTGYGIGHVLRSGVARRTPSAYPGRGWCWENHSTTVRVLDSLVRRGLAVRRQERLGPSRHATRLTPVWHPTPEGVALIERELNITPTRM